LFLEVTALLMPQRRREAGSVAEGDGMSTTCECGVTLEQLGRTARCQECDVAACPSCVIHVETVTYCRWCATVLARHRVA
jgi:hypothetical protein